MNSRKIVWIAVLSGGLFFSGTGMANIPSDNNIDTTATSKNQNMATDGAIRSKVMSILKKYENFVNIKVQNGIVYLTGVLPSDTVYEKVVTKVQSLKSVKDINVEGLTVKESLHPLKDTYTTAKIKGLLIRKDLFDTDIPSWSINVETKNGTVYLSGTVQSDQEKSQVLEAVRSVEGIKGVKDMIKVSADTQKDAG